MESHRERNKKQLKKFYYSLLLGMVEIIVKKKREREREREREKKEKEG